jgi:bifunctional non-homologous end joining protein LigD
MLASLADAPLEDPSLAYEPKYDGIRAIAEVRPPGAGPHARVRLWSRLGNEKTRQFPEIAAALEEWAAQQHASVVFDGEIVALDSSGEPTGFQHLQGRIHLADGARPDDGDARPRVAYIAFDLLREGRTDVRDRPFLERRAALERVLTGVTPPHGGHRQATVIRISEVVRGDGRALYQRALERGWEGLIAKHIDSTYKSGKRTPEWRKLKIVHEQEFVIGGWTEPRQTRTYFGALLLGVHEKPTHRAPGNQHRADAAAPLVYVGHTGTGFSEQELARVMSLLGPLEVDACPFRERPRTNERPHWVRPTLVAQVKFTEWTADGKLRHPVYLGLRDDKRPADVVREPIARVSAGKRINGQPSRMERSRPVVQGSGTLLEQITEIERSGRNGRLELPGGDHLPVTNLHKIFWPKQKLTKGDLFRYYVRVADVILPTVADRPLVMKRFPNGIAATPFYQHRITDVPPGVRVEIVTEADRRPQVVGGTLKTLLYMVQLAAISQDPWFSRVGSLSSADYAALDLDPAPDVPFRQVLEVARAVAEELEALDLVGVPKTSGADGLHVYIPLPRGTPYDAGLLFCQIVATVVARKHPRIATVERAIAGRGRRVYVDCLQNVLGKTLATAYSARASPHAGVSAPLTWREVQDGVRREDFTIRTMSQRIEASGDLWGALRRARAADLSRVLRYADRQRAHPR